MPSGSADRKSIADGAEPADAAPREDDAELDVSLERYEYAATSSILAGTGGVGFAATCAFNREKSATKELLELLRPHVRWRDDAEADADGVDDPAVDGAGLRDESEKDQKATSPPPRLRLNPVKMPGRGFVFVRLSVAKEQTKDEQDTGETKEDEKTYEQRVSKSLGRAVSRAARALTASVRAGAVPSPRWVEKVVAIQATCAMPEISETAAETDKAETASSVLRDTVKRVVACLDAEALQKSRTAGGSDDGKDDDGKDVLRFAVAFANRFRGMGGETKNKTRDSSNSFKRYAREFVVPAVAAAAESALGTTKISLTDPDVCFFVEVLSVPNEGADGSRAGGYVERLAIGAAAKCDGVFELKRGAIRPVALKRASEATG
mmetsp:Transcript_6843/g.29137  ORF Transcript_6843/g.29137 Transcript_6843/m.29137 type:complete len:379 (-) Transcript_6843:63-1199(-)